jgi:RimJ/RimL family protein N-acetyltransferase
MARPPVVQGTRLILRPFAAEDIGDDYLSWLNDPERLRFSRHAQQSHDAATSAAYRLGFDGTPHYFWAVAARADGRLVGTMTAYAEDDATDVGILIGRPRAGFGSEAWGMALDHLLRVEARAKVTGGCAAEHAAMRRIFERWGMEREGVDGSGEGDPATATVRYGVTREAWQRRSAAGFSR